MKTSPAPTSEGIPLRNICFIILVVVLARKWGWARQREVGGKGEGLTKLNHYSNFNNIPLPVPPPVGLCSLTHTHTHTHTHRGNEFQNGDGASTVICFWRLPSNRDITDLIRTYRQFFYSSSYNKMGSQGGAKMLMVHPQLLQTIKKLYESTDVCTLTQFCAVVEECKCHLLSLYNFALRRILGNWRWCQKLRANSDRNLAVTGSPAVGESCWEVKYSWGSADWTASNSGASYILRF